MPIRPDLAPDPNLPSSDTRDISVSKIHELLYLLAYGDAANSPIFGDTLDIRITKLNALVYKLLNSGSGAGTLAGITDMSANARTFNQAVNFAAMTALLPVTSTLSSRTISDSSSYSIQLSDVGKTILVSSLSIITPSIKIPSSFGSEGDSFKVLITTSFGPTTCTVLYGDFITTTLAVVRVGQSILFRKLGGAWQVENIIGPLHKSTHATGGSDALSPADIGAAMQRLIQTGDFTAVLFGRYSATSGGNINITDPTGTTAGQLYTVIVSTGTVTFSGSGTTYTASRIELVRVYNGSAWVTIGPVLSDPLAVNAAAYTKTSGISESSIDWSLSNSFSKTLAANAIFTFANVSDGQNIAVAVTNTASNYTVTWPTTSPYTVVWSGGNIPVQTIGEKTDVYSFYRCGSVIYASVIQNF